MTTTNVPAIEFAPSGITLPNESDLLTGVLADMNSAFGGGMSTSLSSPQGQLAQSMTAIVGDKNDQIALLVNQVNPDTADGRFQDAIGRIYFLTRTAASGTIVTGTCIGLVGTVIPAGTIVQDISGYQYASTFAAVIPAGGAVDVQFQCTTMGPIVCPPGAMNTIYKAVTGLDSVTNPAPGAIGTNVESRADFEFRRRNSVAVNALNSPQSIYAAVLGVDNVVDAYVIDNPTSVAAATGTTNYPIAPHSVYIAVAGGAAPDIAQAIWSKKPPGCDYNGNTSYTVIDSANYLPPFPSYSVTWMTPAPLPVFFAVSLVNSSRLPANIITLVRNAIVAAFNGTDGGSRARIGSTIYAGRYYAGIAAIDRNVEILSVLMGASYPATSPALGVGIDQLPTLTAANISVTLA